MRRTSTLLGLCLLLLLPLASAAGADCAIGGHNETSENFTTAAGGWAALNMTPGFVAPVPVGSHLLISEVAPRGAGTGAGSDSSEYVEIYNPTSSPVSLDNLYLSDDSQYYKIVNGTYLAADPNDWTVRFPSGLVLHPGRTALVCVTKVGFAGSGASPDGAEYFLEMKNTNGNPSDDMILLTTNSTLSVAGGSFTNPSTTNGEWVALFCWNGASDLVADLDYASWGANSTSNPKLNKTGISIDGPDGDLLPSTYNADTPAASQTNLGTALTKPNTFQRTAAGEVGEVTVGGNGSRSVHTPTLTLTEWTTLGTDVRFHLRWANLDPETASEPTSVTLHSQQFGAHLADFGTIGGFSVPAIAPSSFFDVFFEVPLSELPPPPEKRLPGGGPPLGWQCPPDSVWAGNVHVIWDSLGVPVSVWRHFGQVLVNPGQGPSYIHVITNCANPAAWAINGVCQGFNVTLVNEDKTAAANPVPAGWTGFICVTSPAGTAGGLVCCFNVTFVCNGVPGVVQVCATTCQWPMPHAPTLDTVEWSMVDAENVRFHLRWANHDPDTPSESTSGGLHSQEFGAFLPDFGTIGSFAVPPITPDSFFDVFFDVPLSALPLPPEKVLPNGGPPLGWPCPRDTVWAGNVDVLWDSLGVPIHVQWHWTQVLVNPGMGASLIHVVTNCTSPAAWAINGLCPGFNATLVGEDKVTPAPNPLPAGWMGYILVSSPAGTAGGLVCCFKVVLTCNGVPGVLRVCATTCVWPQPHEPALDKVEWSMVDAGNVRFHMRWANHDPETASQPTSGSMQSQEFGAFLPDYGFIGEFNVPPIMPESFFDVFFDVPLGSLPPPPEKVLPNGGPPLGWPCPRDTVWAGNVDVYWDSLGVPINVQWHWTQVLVNPGVGASLIHVVTNCASPAAWAINGLCNGFNATLVNADKVTPAPNPLPAGWAGYVVVSSPPGTAGGLVCCFTVVLTCNGVPGVLRVCATTCQWPSSGVPGEGLGADFGIRTIVPNPTRGTTTITFGVPRSTPARLELVDVSGKRVRTLIAGQVPAGIQTVVWDGRAESGAPLPAGIYFLTLKAEGHAANRTLILFR